MQKFCHIMAVFSQNRSTRAMLSQMQSAIFITMKDAHFVTSPDHASGTSHDPVMEMSPTSISLWKLPARLKSAFPNVANPT